MHELSIAQNIIEQAERYAKESGALKVKSIDLQIGTLSGAVVECLEFALPLISKDTLLEDCQFNFEKIPLELKCNQCQNITVREEVLIQCELCLSTDLKVIKGQEMIIRTMEIE